ncbi:MAG: heparinase II/III domain-containing protein [Terracidiphilus sp.]
MNISETITRRSLIKLMALASPAFCASTSLVSEASPIHFFGRKRNASEHPGRPRLFYDAASLERMKQMLAANADADAALKESGDELLAADFYPETVAEIGGGQQANYHTPGNQIADMGLTLGLLFQLTGEARYAEKLRAAMLYYVQYARWAGPGLIDRKPPWHSELDTTTFSFGYACGYDALHAYLTEADRKTIAEGMVRLAVVPTLEDWILPGVRIHSLDSMGHNWWGVCVTGAGLCSLALLGDDKRAQEWIDAVDAGFTQWFNYPGNVLQNRMPTFERSGPSYEGVNYMNYSVSQYLHYRLAWMNTYPGRQAARLEPLDGAAGFFLQTLYPATAGFYSVDFEDAPLHVDVTATILLLAACGLGTPDGARYLKLVQTHPTGTLLDVLRQQSLPAADGDAPLTAIYPHLGWATMRTSWENDATLMAMKSGYTWNHAHADAGSFMIFHKGAPLIIDSGMCSYARPEYTSYYRQSRAHNVILFNGEGQPAEDLGYGCKFPGHTHALVDGLGLKYVYADATGPMARFFSRNYRSWLWSGDTILVIDDVKVHTEGKLDWLLHFDGDYTANADGSVNLKNGAAAAQVEFLYPAVTHREETGLAVHDPDRKIPYLAFSPATQARFQQFLVAICLNPDAAPKYEFLQGFNYIGVRTTTPQSVDETYLNVRAIEGSIARSSMIAAGEWVTDAYILSVSRPAAGAAPTRYFVSDGSYLRRGDASLIESLSKLTACWSSGEKLAVFTDGAPASIQLAAERHPRSVLWNAQPVAAAGYDREKRLVSLVRTDGGDLVDAS